MLLHGFRLAAARSARPGSRSERHRWLLEAFTETHQRSVDQGARRTRLFADLLEGHGAAFAKWQERQRDAAEHFDLLEVLGLTRSEIRHTRMLAWLLDRNVRKLGTHAQANLGLHLLLSELDLPAELADAPYSVRREVGGDESRVDLEVAARGCLLIHIEVKIGAREGDRQTFREWEDLLRRATALAIPEASHASRVFALFLTPEGNQPSNAKFQAVSWRQVARVLDDFAGQARPAEVKLFAAHYARSLRRFVLTRDEREKEKTDG